MGQETNWEEAMEGIPDEELPRFWMALRKLAATRGISAKEVVRQLDEKLENIAERTSDCLEPWMLTHDLCSHVAHHVLHCHPCAFLIETARTRKG